MNARRIADLSLSGILLFATTLRLISPPRSIVGVSDPAAISLFNALATALAILVHVKLTASTARVACGGLFAVGVVFNSLPWLPSCGCLSRTGPSHVPELLLASGGLLLVSFFPLRSSIQGIGGPR